MWYKLIDWQAVDLHNYIVHACMHASQIKPSDKNVAKLTYLGRFITVYSTDVYILPVYIMFYYIRLNLYTQ